MRRFLTICATLVVLSTGVRCTALAQGSDSFLTGTDPNVGEYASPGLLESQNPIVAGWSGAWVNQPGVLTADIIDSGLSFGSLETDGGAAQFPGFQGGRTGRQLTTPYFGSANETVYFSFLMDATGVFQGEVDAEDFGNVIPGYTYSGFELHDLVVGDGNRELQISVGDNFVNEPDSGLDPNSRGHFYVRVQNDTSTAVDLGSNDGGTNLFVLKLELSSAAASDTVTVYRNPEDLTDESSSTADAVISGLDLVFNLTSFARFDPSFNDPNDPIAPMPESSEPVTFDELRFGSSFTSVLPISSLPGDFDGNGRVDGVDFLNWQSNPALGSLSDWETNYGTVSIVANAGSVPEPSSLVFLSLASSFSLLCRHGWTS